MEAADTEIEKMKFMMQNRELKNQKVHISEIVIN
jgi:hypothetical protein